MVSGKQTTLPEEGKSSDLVVVYNITCIVIYHDNMNRPFLLDVEDLTEYPMLTTKSSSQFFSLFMNIIEINCAVPKLAARNEVWRCRDAMALHNG